jgi:hypothetical protein
MKLVSQEGASVAACRYHTKKTNVGFPCKHDCNLTLSGELHDQPVIANPKGGVSKTTLSTNVAVILRGHAAALGMRTGKVHRNWLAATGQRPPGFQLKSVAMHQ